MSFKTILAILDSEAEAARLTQIATGLAKSFSAHLIGLHIQGRVYVPTVVHGEILDGLIATQRQAAEARSKRMAASFQQATAQAGVAAQWRKEEAIFESATHLMLHHARAADLVVVEQPDASVGAFDGLCLSEEVMLGAGRPVLVVPKSFAPAHVGERVLIGWNDSRESARALFDALPFLKQARIVHVVAGKPAPTIVLDAEPPSPTAEVTKTLERHGIGCTVIELDPAPSDMAAALHTTAQEHGCDLVVMGGYGHWRFSEFVFGGATRGMLREMTIPVLMSH
jgi:nucleotide-binding universal stress UspA family protein